MFDEYNNSQQQLTIVLDLLISVLTYIVLYLAATLALVCTILTSKLVCIQTSRLFKHKPDAKKAIIITGATSGLGLEAAKHLYNLGFTVFACYIDAHEAGYKELSALAAPRSSFDPLDPLGIEQPSNETSKQSQQKSNQLVLVKIDVRNVESIEKAANYINTILDKNDYKLHCLVNNAAVSCEGPFEASSRAVVRNIVDTNLLGTLLVTRQFLLRLIEDSGRVVFVGSYLGEISGSKFATYAATKAAMHNFARGLREDLRRYRNIKTVTILPGNFFAMSAMMFQAVKNMELAENDATCDERRVYTKSRQEWRNNLSKFLAERMAGKQCIDQLTTSAQFDIRLDELEENMKSAERKQQLGNRNNNNTNNLLYRCICKLGGNASTRPINECSGALGAYDDAVRLQDPPKLLYAGDFLFSFVTGPLLVELLPPSCVPLFTQLVSASLRES